MDELPIPPFNKDKEVKNKIDDPEIAVIKYSTLETVVTT
jgi:hypothetical protein